MAHIQAGFVAENIGAVYTRTTLNKVPTICNSGSVPTVLTTQGADHRQGALAITILRTMSSYPALASGGPVLTPVVNF